MLKWFSRLFGSLFGNKPPEPPQPTVQIAPQPPQYPPPVLPYPKPPPAPPAPDPAALEPVRPALADSPPGITRFGQWAAAVPQPSAGEVYPATHSWGDWRDVREGESPDAYYARTSLAGYGRTGAELMALNAARVASTDFGKHAATAMATGPFDPRSLTDIDLNWLWHCASAMNFDPRNLMHGLLYGPDVGRAGAQRNVNAIPDFAGTEARVTPALVQAVREMAQGEVKPWMATAFMELGAEQWRTDHLASWRDGWKRLHPGQEP